MTVDLRTRLKEKLARLDPDVRAVIEELVAELERQRAMLERLLHFQDLMERALENQRRIVGILEQLNQLSQRFEAMLQDTQQTLQELVNAQARLEARMTALEQRQDRTEQRLDKVEQRLDKVEQRLDKVEQRLDKVEQRLDKVEQRLDKVEQRLDKVEQRLDKVEQRLDKVEQRLDKVEQRLDKVEQRLDKVEQRLDKVEQRLDKVEQRLDDLTATVRQMQQEMAEMRAEFEDRFQMLHRRLEGISHSLGYFLENRALVVLPILLKQAYGIEVEGDLERRYVNVAGKMRQINIIGYGVRDGQRLLIVGETKVRPSKKEITRFLKTCQGLAEQEGLPLFPVIVAHDFPPEVQRFLEQEGVVAVPSYRIDKLWFERGGI